MEVNRLLGDELTYELLIRGADINGKVDEKRKLLRELMRTEEQVPNALIPGIKPLEELTTCSNKLDELLGYLQEFNYKNSNNEYQRIFSRLTHVDQRLKRIQTTEANLISKRDHLIRVCGELCDNLHMMVRQPQPEPPPLLRFDDPAESGSVQPERTISPVAALVNSGASTSAAVMQNSRRVSFPNINSSDLIVNSTTRLTEQLNNVNVSRSYSSNFPSPVTYLPVRKWNLIFNGDSSVSAFIERVEELRIARGVTKDQLLQSAVEMFTDDALVWFRSVRDTVVDWDDLVAKLRLTFLPHDYESELWDEIRNRTQHETERVSVFIAVMENMFRRLPTLPTESVRLATIRKNLLPRFVTRLALHQIDTVSKLIETCKAIEDAQASAMKYKPPPTNYSRLLERDLAFRKGKDRSFLSSVEETTTTRPSLDQTNDIQIEGLAAINSITCWNCRQAGHRASQCSKQKTLHCYRCGEQNFTTRTCPKCSGKGNPSH